MGRDGNPYKSRLEILIGRIWVCSTILLISFIAYSSQIFVIIPALGLPISQTNLPIHLVIFNILVAILFYNYYLTIVTPPGSVPPKWEPSPGTDFEVKRLTGRPRYCRMCAGYKPPRAHHCRQCKQCVLRMDHHCPWVNNCVGHYNYGHFIRFLLLVDICCSYHLYLISTRAFGALSFHTEPDTTFMLMLIMNYVFCVPVLLAVGVFSLYHFWCLCTNTTTIEGWEKDRVALLIKRGKIREVKYPYDIGILENIKSVLGPSPLLWLYPHSQVPGDGLYYATAKGTSFEEWPPKDPYAPSRSSVVKRLDSLRRRPVVSQYPPYHPDYTPPEQEDEEDEDEDRPLIELVKTCDGRQVFDEELQEERKVRIRRGSEGYEVAPITRQPVEENWDELYDDKYNYYEPEPEETDSECD